MNEIFAPRSTPSSSLATWSTRLLLLSLIGILFLTLFPFRLTLHAHLPANRSPFLLGGWGKDANSLNVFLNILLFVPFGFAVTEKYRERGSARAGTLIWIVILGGLFSYTIELLQLHIPLRDSGWEDVVTNSIGSAAGFILFELFGRPILRFLTAGESALGDLLKLPRGAAIISIYFLSWFAISVPMQRQTRLRNWDPSAKLLVGNDASGRAFAAWKGTLFRLQIWDRALSPEMVLHLPEPGEQGRVPPGLVADYTFAASPPFLDRTSFLPELVWTSNSPGHADPGNAAMEGSSWLASRLPVPNLVAALQRSNQFAIRVVCSPAAMESASGRIVSISRRSGPVDLQIRQEGAGLVFWFRNPLSVNRSLLAWHVPDVFTSHRPRDILFSYDGADLSLFLGGKLEPDSYRLGPGVALARIVRLVRPQELSGYNFIYYSLLFFPAGALLGIAARRLAWRNLTLLLFIVLGFLLPSLSFEFILVWVSGRPVSFSHVALSAILTVAGCLWINADRRSTACGPRRFPAIPG